eukprot:Opistho-2@14166
MMHPNGGRPRTQSANAAATPGLSHSLSGLPQSPSMSRTPGDLSSAARPSPLKESIVVAVRVRPISPVAAPINAAAGAQSSVPVSASNFNPPLAAPPLAAAGVAGATAAQLPVGSRGRSASVSASGFSSNTADTVTATAFTAAADQCFVASSQERCVKTDDGGVIGIETNGKREKSYAFDYVAGEQSSQADVFQKVAQDVVSRCLQGYNGTIFVYGQTGSGKTHTMFGTHESEGIVPRAIDRIFEQIGKARLSEDEQNIDVTCHLTMLEIYNECIYDLLGDANQKLALRESASKGIFVENLSTHEIVRAFDAIELVRRAFSNRSVAVTGMNRESSRSHVVLTITVDTRKDNTTKRSRLNFVDLAGSERQRDIQSSTPSLTRDSSASGSTGHPLSPSPSDGSVNAGGRERRSSLMRESENINKSLSALTGVITALSESESGRQHVPYRDSKLTFLLKDSLGGNSRTRIIATVNPLQCYRGDTMATLGFAARAKSIKCSIHANEAIVSPQSALVSALEEEIATLKLALAKAQVHEEYSRVMSAPPVSVERSTAECGVQTDHEEETGAGFSAGEFLGGMVTRLRTSVGGPAQAIKELKDANAALQMELNSMRGSLDEKSDALRGAHASAEEDRQRWRSLETDYELRMERMQGLQNADREALAELVPLLNASESRCTALASHAATLEGQCAKLRAQSQTRRESTDHVAVMQASLERAESERKENAGRVAQLEAALEKAFRAREEDAEVSAREQESLYVELSHMRSDNASLEALVDKLRREIETQGVALLEEAEELNREMSALRDENAAKDAEIRVLLEDVEESRLEVRALKESRGLLESAFDDAEDDETTTDLAAQLRIARHSNEVLQSQLMALTNAIDTAVAASGTMDGNNAPPGHPNSTQRRCDLSAHTAQAEYNAEHVGVYLHNDGGDSDDDSMAYSESLQDAATLASSQQRRRACNRASHYNTNRIDEEGMYDGDLSEVPYSENSFVQQGSVPPSAPFAELPPHLAEVYARGRALGEKILSQSNTAQTSQSENTVQAEERGLRSSSVRTVQDSRSRDSVSFASEVRAIEPAADATVHPSKHKRKRRMSERLDAFKGRIRSFLRSPTEDDASVISALSTVDSTAGHTPAPRRSVSAVAQSTPRTHSLPPNDARGGHFAAPADSLWEVSRDSDIGHGRRSRSMTAGTNCINNSNGIHNINGLGMGAELDVGVGVGVRNVGAHALAVATHAQTRQLTARIDEIACASRDVASRQREYSCESNARSARPDGVSRSSSVESARQSASLGFNVNAHSTMAMGGD